jgi:aryl-phospho-beta-D-glucosidase BglC (GH1 family)
MVNRNFAHMKANLLIIGFLSYVSLAFADEPGFWNFQKKGANCFNKIPQEQWFSDAKDLGLEWVRLAYDKWDSEHRDFLIGDASDYKGLVNEDLDKLKQVILWADKYDIKIVIAPLSLPGSRYLQNNGFKPDSRLWESYDYWDQAINFWVDLVKELKDYDNIVAYNIVNEPHPELGAGVEEHYSPGDVTKFYDWYDKVQNTPRDIYKFYTKIIREIRKADPDKAIMLDAGWYGQPGAFCYWPKAFSDKNILYAFHMYEPYEFTSNKNFKEQNNYVYPGNVPFGNDTIYWDKNTIETYFKPFLHWVKENEIPGSRIVAGEFGCMRKNTGADRYLKDVIDFLNKNMFHWAFYSFREDEWDGYDYELGTEGLSWKYWQAKERGENLPLPRKDNELFNIVKQQYETDD